MKLLHVDAGPESASGCIPSKYIREVYYLRLRRQLEDINSIINRLDTVTSCIATIYKHIINTTALVIHQNSLAEQGSSAQYRIAGGEEFA